MTNKLITWSDFYEANNQLIKLIQANGKQYDFILAITRGGVFPAYFLAKALNLPIETINLSSYKDQKSGKIQEVLVEGFSKKILKPENCLLVDDIFDSGQTIKYVQNLYPQIDTACTFSRWENHTLTYAGGVLNYDTWIDFPWEVMWDGHEKLSEPL
jgi:hypoxanthine phosphoribosyltransferase